MRFVGFVRSRQWTIVAGYGLFVAVITAGYYYNLTLVQLGLLDLGTRLVGLSPARVSLAMGALALVALVSAIVVGVGLDRSGVGRDLRAKLRLLWGVVLVQLGLTIVVSSIRTWPVFVAWVLLCAVSLGAGMPTAFALAIDLVPVADRGWVAGLATGAAYLLANVYPLQWRIEAFSLIVSAGLVPAVVGLGWLAFRENPIVAGLADRHRDPAIGVGRFCRPVAVDTRSLEFGAVVVLMFGVFFVDSLGFLRIIETPAYIGTAWQSPSLWVHLAIGGVHVLAAAMAGVLYTNFGRRWLFALVFGLFGFTHLMYVFDVRSGVGEAPLLLPLLYAAAVSVYTVINFAIWPDLSTPATIGRHAAIGVGFAGFLATFLSTAVVLYMESAGVALETHLTLVNGLALLLFAVLVVGIYLRRLVQLARERRVPM